MAANQPRRAGEARKRAKSASKAFSYEVIQIVTTCSSLRENANLTAPTAKMKKGHPNHRRIKIHRSYVVEEIASLLGIHKNTVRRWVKIGLSTCDDKRPMLIRGHDLASFLQARRARNKRHCRPGEMYCVRCRAPKLPAGDMAEYQWLTEKCGNLVAICPDCHSIMNRRVSAAKLALVRGRLEITFPQALQRLRESIHSTVNSDLREETQSHANAQCG
jgi:hypothetical protein